MRVISWLRQTPEDPLSRRLAPSRLSVRFSYTESLTDMAVTEQTWTKAAQQRITSMAFCPLRSKLVLAAADKSGVLGRSGAGQRTETRG